MKIVRRYDEINLEKAKEAIRKIADKLAIQSKK